MALNEATARSPCTSPSRSAEEAVSSAVSGPIRTRTRLPRGTNEVITPWRWLSAESAGAARAIEISHGWMTTPTGPSPCSTERTTTPPSRTTSVRPFTTLAGASAEEVAAGEACDERARRGGDELGGRPDLEQASLEHDADAIGERGCVFEVVSYEQGRQPELADQLAELDPDGGTGVGIERRERLVEEQHARFAGERPREADPLALAAGEGCRSRLGQMLDAQAPEQLRHTLPTAAEGNVALDVQVRKEGVVLEHETDGAPLRWHVPPRRRVEPDVGADGDPAGVGPEETSHRTQHGRLAGPRGADERDRLPSDLER